MVASGDGMKRSRDLECDHFYEISVREHVDFPKRVVEHLYSCWKRSHIPVSININHFNCSEVPSMSNNYKCLILFTLVRIRKPFFQEFLW